MAAVTQGATTYKFGVVSTFAPDGTTAVHIQGIEATKASELSAQFADATGKVVGSREDDVTLGLNITFQADAVPDDELGDVLSITYRGAATSMVLVGKSQSYVQDGPATFTYNLRKRSAITHA
jgi:hypothetical protein